jgi:hypothetical protein
MGILMEVERSMVRAIAVCEPDARMWTPGAPGGGRSVARSLNNLRRVARGAWEPKVEVEIERSAYYPGVMRGLSIVAVSAALAACAGPSATGKSPAAWPRANTAVRDVAVDDRVPAPPGISAEIVAAGTATAEAVASQSAPDTGLGSVDVIPGEAAVGTSFGLRVIVRGRPRLTIVPLRTRVTHPPLSNPGTGKTNTVDEWASPINAELPRYTGWRFDHPWEVVPGAWRIELLDQDRPIAVQVFTITVK